MKDGPAHLAVRAVEDRSEAIAFRGRVLAPDGQPAAGAGVYTVAPRDGGGGASRPQGKGRRRWIVPLHPPQGGTRSRRGGPPLVALTVLATADGLGPDWVDLKKPPDEELTLRLVEDSVPISGRILDLQGRPVVGAKVTRGGIKAEGPGGIDPI